MKEYHASLDIERRLMFNRHSYDLAIYTCMLAKPS